MSPDEGIDWGPYAFDVWVNGSTSPRPIARFEYGTQAAEWAQQQYPNRYELRAVPTTAQAVKVAAGGAPPLTPEGFVPDAEAAMHAYRRRWHDARTEVDRLRAAIYVLVDWAQDDRDDRPVQCMVKDLADAAASAAKAAQSGGCAPSPPEGISTPPPSAHTTMLLNTIGRQRDQIADLKATIAHERQQHAEASEKHAAEYHRIATALGCHVHDDLAAKAAQARGASVPPPADSAIAEGPAG